MVLRSGFHRFLHDEVKTMSFTSKRTVLSTLIGLSLLSFGASAHADVILNPNFIRGQVRFTNTNPAVVTLLNQIGLSAAQVNANNNSIGYTSSTSTSLGTPLALSYELAAESAAGGPSGIAYDLLGQAQIYVAPSYMASGTYTFPVVPGVVLQPLAQQPNGTTADITDCVGLVHFRFGQDAQCNTPFVVGNGGIITSSGQSGFYNTSEHYVVVHGGTNEVQSLGITLGTDPSLDIILLSTPVTLNVACDQIQEICVDRASFGNPSALGSLRGPFDVLGETEQQTTFVGAHDGPGQNFRWKSFTPPGMPVASPASWWELPNMVPGDYSLYAQGYVRTGRRTNWFSVTELCPTCQGGVATVTQGVASDLLRNIGGKARYPFVMTPAFFRGNIVLADPFVTANPGASSMLEHLSFNTQGETGLGAHGVAPEGGAARTSFPGAFDTTTGLLTSDYELLVMSTYDIAHGWRADGLSLAFKDPVDGREEGGIDVYSDATDHLMAPGDETRLDHAYCFGEVTLSYTSASGQFFDPTAGVTGGLFNGKDWQGQLVSYNAGGQFRGTPQGSANASASGQVRMILPQGSYTVYPGASISSPSGISTADFAATQVAVGCGQRLSVAPGLSISAELPACAPSAAPTLSGQVSSSGAAVDRIWYKVNGGPEIDICNSGSCFPDAQFSVPVNLAACGNTVEVFVSSGGQTASVTTQTTWEDPSDGIDCEGACEPPPPPPPADSCATVSAENVACSGGDGFELSVNITNDTSEPLTHVMLPDPRVSQHVVALPSPLAPGDSTSITIKVSGNPGTEFCTTVGFTDASHEECCSTQLCVELPACCFAVKQDKAACIPGAPGGTFTYALDWNNRTTDVIEHVFFFPPAGVTVSPDYVDVPSVVPGASSSIGPLTITGGTPGQTMCLTMGIHDKEMNQCCAEDVCFEVPQPCGKQPDSKEPVMLRADAPQAQSCTVSSGTGSAGRSAGAGLLLGLAALARVSRRRRR
jgi:hypothetical protein